MKRLNLDTLDDAQRDEELCTAAGEALVLDVETTVKGIIGSKASPWERQNYIVQAGIAPLRYPEIVKTIRMEEHDRGKSLQVSTIHGHVRMFVGHNLKFDMNWLRQYGLQVFHTDPWNGFCNTDTALNPTFYKHGAIWDTQIAEYLLSGQSHKFPKLDTLMRKYNLPMKDDYFKDAWDRGEQTETMDQDKLEDYLKNDVTGTGKIAIKQMEEAAAKGMTKFIASQMMASMAVHEMENNGIFIDTNVLGNIHHNLKQEMEHLDLLIRIDLQMHLSVTPDIVAHINLNSNQHIAALLFGGKIKYKEKVQDGFYKNGKPKLRLKEFEIVCPPSVSARYHTTTAKGGVKVDASTLKKIVADPSASTSGRMTNVITKLLRVKELSKQIGTYCEGLSKLVGPDGIVHHTIHETSTATGRRSSANPNGQNIPSHESSDIKKAFRSRWGDKGVILEADYSQLEVIGLAFLTRDKQLMYDVSHGVDMHTETGKIVFGHKMTKTERRIAKVINFGLIYGGGAATLAEQAGVDVKLAKQLINAFYQRYPDVKTWQAAMQAKVESLAHYAGDNINGMPVKRAVVESVTGRRYMFVEELYRGNAGFSPTKIKNYFVQGLATGDIVPLVLGRMFKELLNDDYLGDKCLMVNTVHDSIIFDCHVDWAHRAVDLIKEVMESAPDLLESELGVKFDLPLKVEIEAGPSWGELTKIA